MPEANPRQFSPIHQPISAIALPPAQKPKLLDRLVKPCAPPLRRRLKELWPLGQRFLIRCIKIEALRLPRVLIVPPGISEMLRE